MKALATTSAKRSAVLPEVPTVGESLAGYEADGWHALFVPAGTPGEIVARLNAAAVRIMHGAEMKARLSDLGLECMGSATQDLRRFHQSEYLKWGKIAKDNDIRFE